jgi:hypothetical protein
MATRSQSATPDQQILPQFNSEEFSDISSVVDFCYSNLDFVEQFILKSKEGLAMRQHYQTSIQNIRVALRHMEKTANPNSSNFDEKLKEIVENAIESKLKSNEERDNPTYSQIAAKNPRNPPMLKPSRNCYKVIIKPHASLKNIKTAEDTRKILTSKSPKQLNINVDKITPLRNNAILIESRCESILNLPSSEILKSLKLEAERVNKFWPKIQIFDVPKNMEKDELISEISKQDTLPDTIPKDFIKSAFKTGQPKDDSNTWVIELHPAARNHFMRIGKIYIQWKSLNIKDYLRVTRCFNCQKYGHVSKYCQSEKQCGICAATNHETRNCMVKDNEQKHKCANCVRSRQSNTNHQAGDSECPIYLFKRQDLINNTLYG